MGDNRKDLKLPLSVDSGLSVSVGPNWLHDMLFLRRLFYGHGHHFVNVAQTGHPGCTLTVLFAAFRGHCRDVPRQCRDIPWHTTTFRGIFHGMPQNDCHGKPHSRLHGKVRGMSR